MNERLQFNITDSESVSLDGPAILGTDEELIAKLEAERQDAIKEYDTRLKAIMAPIRFYQEKRSN
jgi:hypothetical protein